MNTNHPSSHGTVSIIGRRKVMEDAVMVEKMFLKAKKPGAFDFYGVYDGHGGAHVANACRERLHSLVAEEVTSQPPWEVEESTIRWREVMERAFERMDDEVKEHKIMGSTAVVAVVSRGEVVVANCGDSRAVLSRGGEAVAMSEDHKAGAPAECQRIEAAGGKVIDWNGQRVFGVLSTSRAIGDGFLKPFVIPKPDVKVVKIREEDEFLILATDGLWDVMSREGACKVVRKLFSKRDKRVLPSKVAAILAEGAVARGSSDNVTVVVVDLRS